MLKGGATSSYVLHASGKQFIRPVFPPLSSGSVAPGEIAALRHEPGDNPMEGGAGVAVAVVAVAKRSDQGRDSRTLEPSVTI